MKLSLSGIGSTRLQNLDKMFPAQDILMQSNQLLQYSAGIYGYNNVPLILKQNIETIVKDVLNKYDCIEVSLPTLQPQSLWDKSGRWTKYIADGTMLTVQTDKHSYGLAPTAEEAVTEFATKKIKSYKDMPCTLYQIGEKFRNELRNRGYLLRGKSFSMMDAYSFDLSEEDLIASYENIKKAYIEIFDILGLEAHPVVADNGAIGGKKSEEFMVIDPSGEDTILYDKVSGKYLNSEILEREDCIDYLKNEYGITNVEGLESKKAIEIGHIFQLGTTYSKSMNATYTDNEGKAKNIYMGCYGIGVSRLVAVLYEKNLIIGKNNEPSGISLPFKYSPYLLQIVVKTDNEEKFNQANELYGILKNNHIPIIFDDRQHTTFGSKIMDCKILGTPFMAVIGDKVENGFVEVENTKTGEKTILSQTQLIDKLIELNFQRLKKDYEDMKELV